MRLPRVGSGVDSFRTADAERGGNNLKRSKDIRAGNGSSHGHNLALTGLFATNLWTADAFVSLTRTDFLAKVEHLSVRIAIPPTPHLYGLPAVGSMEYPRMCQAMETSLRGPLCGPARIQGCLACKKPHPPRNLQSIHVYVRSWRRPFVIHRVGRLRWAQIGPDTGEPSA